MSGGFRSYLHSNLPKSTPYHHPSCNIQPRAKLTLTAQTHSPPPPAPLPRLGCYREHPTQPRGPTTAAADPQHPLLLRVPPRSPPPAAAAAAAVPLAAPASLPCCLICCSRLLLAPVTPAAPRCCRRPSPTQACGGSTPRCHPLPPLPRGHHRRPRPHQTLI